MFTKTTLNAGKKFIRGLLFLNLILFWFIGLNAKADSIHLSGIKIPDVLSIIEEETDFVFIYKTNVLKNQKVLDIHFTKEEIETVDDIKIILNQVFQGTNITYEIVDRQIILSSKPLPKNQEIVKSRAISKVKEINEKTLTGIVTDSTGSPIPGATVIVRGTTIGAITDLQGRFTIEVPEYAKELQISFIGYESQIISIGNRTFFEITLVEKLTDLEEVVVVSYGTQKKESVIGAISGLKGESIKTIATSNLSNSIGGQMTGVFSKMGEGKPGDDDAQIYIRGKATLNSTDVLILVDGIESDFSRINPNDIESFSVLKDASATAVYGVRGANGVILVTTKRGVSNKTTVQFNSQVRLHRIIKYPKLLSSYDYARLYNEAYLNGGNSAGFFTEQDLKLFKTGEDPYGHPDINWFEELTEPNYFEHRHDLSVRGGTDKMRYYVSAEFVSQDGAYKQWDDQKYNTNSTYDRLNFRMNFDFDLTKSSKLNISLSNRIENANDVRSGVIGEVSERNGIWDDIMGIPPMNNPLHNPDGSYGSYGTFGRDLRPYQTLRAGGYINGKDNFFQGSLKFIQKLDFITKGLSFHTMLGRTNKSGYTYRLSEFPAIWRYEPIDGSYRQVSRLRMPETSISNNRIRQTYYIESAFNYDRFFNEDHHVTGLLLYNHDKKSIGADAAINHLGIAGRITYGYKSKYFAEFNVGYNGSDAFQKGNRYALFPAGSLGWVISEEGFWKNNITFIDYLKIRGSYGTAGNDKLGNYAYLYRHIFEVMDRGYEELEKFGYWFGENVTKDKGVRGIKESSLGNDQVTWEVAVKQNIGFDLKMFKDVGLSFDYFKENRSNILTQRNTVSQVLGLERDALPPENIGEVYNHGFEVELRYNRRFSSNWEFNMNSNFSYANNEIIYMDEILQQYDFMNRTGKSIGQYFGYQWTGEFYTYEELGYIWDESNPDPNKYILPENAAPLVPVPDDAVHPGDLKFVDRNGDGKIDTYDIGNIGYTDTPELIYGINLGLGYKNFRFDMFWQGAGLYSVNLGSTQLLTEFKNGGNAHEIHLGRWAYFPSDDPDKHIDTRESATYPRLLADGSPQTRKSSTFQVLEGDYIRFKSAELSYTFPQRLLEPIGLEYLRVFIVGNNLLTFDKIGFIDPENPGSHAAYPQSMFFGFGVNLQF
jgi:TonB-linked SusC/RagA family outer membrane protein